MNVRMFCKIGFFPFRKRNEKRIKIFLLSIDIRFRKQNLFSSSFLATTCIFTTFGNHRLFFFFYNFKQRAFTLFRNFLILKRGPQHLKNILLVKISEKVFKRILINIRAAVICCINADFDSSL